MRKIKRLACAAAAACLALSLSLTGCSTPEYAMTVDGQQVSTGEYLAYLYNVYYSMAQNFALYQMYGMDPWAQTVPYGEGDDAEKLSLSDYIKRSAQDSIVRQKALKNLLDQKNIPFDAERLKEVEEALAQMRSDAFIDYGFNNANYEKMLRATQLYEWSLFYGTYGKDGIDPMPEEEVRAYFEDNFLSYKIIEFSLVDSSNKPLSDEEIESYRDRLDKYLSEFEKTGMTSADFDNIIKMKEEDDKPEPDDDDDDDKDDGGTTSSGETSSTDGTSSSTSGDSTSGSTSATGENGGDSDGDKDEEEEETDPNRKDIDANVYGDEDFTNAVKKVEIGKAAIQEYKKSGTTDTIALIFRMDPEKDRKDGENFYEEKRNDILYGAKYEDFDKEVRDYAKTLDVSYNDRAVSMCKPENFVKVDNG